MPEHRVRGSIVYHGVLLALGMLLVCGMLQPGSLAIAQTATNGTSVTLDPFSGPAGSPVAGVGFLTCAGCTGGSFTAQWDDGSKIGTGTLFNISSTQWVFEIDFNVPSHATLGPHNVSFLSGSISATTAAFTVTPSPPTAAGSSFLSAWDSTDSAMLVFGGPTSGLWAFEPATNQWLQFIGAGTGPNVSGTGAMVWDPTDGMLLVVDSNGGIWSITPTIAPYQASGLWRRVATSGPAPSGGGAYTATWNASSGAMLVFGSSTNPGLWSFEPSTNVWQQLTGMTGPQPS